MPKSPLHTLVSLFPSFPLSLGESIEAGICVSCSRQISLMAFAPSRDRTCMDVRAKAQSAPNLTSALLTAEVLQPTLP
jgi:hypothetical protein